MLTPHANLDNILRIDSVIMTLPHTLGHNNRVVQGEKIGGISGFEGVIAKLPVTPLHVRMPGNTLGTMPAMEMVELTDFN